MSVNVRRLIKFFASSLCMFLVAVSPCFGWGPEGHRVVAMIATKHLTPEAANKLKAMVGPHDTLAAISVWADDIREENPETAPWHYIDIPLTASTLDMRRDCREGNCVVARIEKFRTELANQSANPAVRREALEFLVHFIGDLHQPLHCEDNNDQGGNHVQVIFFHAPTNLHAVWDSGILQHEKERDIQLASDLDSRITPAEKTSWVEGSVESWAMESHALAREVAYGKLPSGPTPVLEDAYYDVALPVVERQLQRAGIRLAYVLNQALHE